jgi:hypothetical protein
MASRNKQGVPTQEIERTQTKDPATETELKT